MKPNINSCCSIHVLIYSQNSEIASKIVCGGVCGVCIDTVRIEVAIRISSLLLVASHEVAGIGSLVQEFGFYSKCSGN